MKSPADYLDHVKALIVLHPQIRRWETVREEVLGDKGLFRYRLNLQDGGLLEVFTYFRIEAGDVQIMKLGVRERPCFNILALPTFQPSTFNP